MDGSLVPPGPLHQFKLDPNTGGVLGILTINGNETCGVLTVTCRLEGQTVYTERLTILKVCNYYLACNILKALAIVVFCPYEL